MPTTGRPKLWKPIRRGDIYCSPGCGWGCTFEKYQSTLEAANELARQMGSGWSPRVWENMGWHYSVDRGSMSLSHPYNGDFMVIFAHRWVAHHSDPFKAVQDALEQAQSEADHITSLIGEFG